MEFHPLSHLSNPSMLSSSSSDSSLSSSSTDSSRVSSPGVSAPESPASSTTSLASRVHAVHPPLPSRSRSSTPLVLTADQLIEFDRDGCLHIKAAQVWTKAELVELREVVDDMQSWKDQSGAYMKYYEPNLSASVDAVDPSVPASSAPAAPAKILSRIENFNQYSPFMDEMLNGKRMMSMSSDLFGRASILYKEKINFKLPGSAGFAPHQDVAAGWWMYGQSLHISCLVSIDASTIANGCLEIVRGQHMRGLIGGDWKEIPKDESDKMEWVPIETEVGDILFFDSYVPHRSDKNMTTEPRRALYVTYAPACDGDHRTRYYEDKRLSFPPDCERDPTKEYHYKV